MTKANVFAALTFNLALGAATALPVEKNTVYFNNSINTACGLKNKGFAVLETVYPNNWAAMRITAFDSLGDVRWRDTLTQPDTIWIGFRMIQTEDGGLAILGKKSGPTYESNSDFFIKTDSIGQVVFEKKLGKTSQYNDYIVETPDSGFILGGYGTSDFEEQIQTIYKLDKTGNEVWTRRFHGNPDLRISAAGNAAGTDLLFAGSRRNPDGLQESMFWKADALGGIIWERVLSTGTAGKVSSLEPVSGGGYLLAGSRVKPDYYNEAVLVETDAEGFPIKSQSFGLPRENWKAYSAQSLDEGWVVTGTGNFDRPMVAKIDSLGRVIWVREFSGFSLSGLEKFPVIVQGPGKFVICPPGSCVLFEDPDYLAP